MKIEKNVPSHSPEERKCDCITYKSMTSKFDAIATHTQRSDWGYHGISVMQLSEIARLNLVESLMTSPNISEVNWKI